MGNEIVVKLMSELLKGVTGLCMCCIYVSETGLTLDDPSSLETAWNFRRVYTNLNLNFDSLQ